MLELLPDDLQYRIISQLPWTSIPSAALCCRSWANLVRRRHSSSSCSPQWSQALVRGETSNRHVAEQASENCFAFVSELLTSTGYLAKSTRPDVVIVTATLYWQPHLKSIQEKILEVLPNSKSVHVLCLVASGIIGTDSEGVAHEIQMTDEPDPFRWEGSGLAIALLHLSPSQMIFSYAIQGRSMSKKDEEAYAEDAVKVTRKIETHMQENYRKAGRAPASGRLEQISRAELERNVSCFLIGDTYEHLDVLKSGLESDFKKMHTLGGLCGFSESGTNIFFSSPESRAGKILTKQRAKVRAAALVISNVRSTNATVSGLCQMQSDYQVTKVRVGMPGPTTTWNKICSVAKVLEDGELAAMEEHPNEAFRIADLPGYDCLFGVQHEVADLQIDSQPGPSCIEPRKQVQVIGRLRFDHEGISVPVPLKGGERCSFYTHTAEASLDELSCILSTVSDSGECDRARPPNDHSSNNNHCFGAIMVICTARGCHLHDRERNVETTLIQKALPSLPIIGFFANGELGPLPYRVWQGDHAKKDVTSTTIQGNTSVLSILRTRDRKRSQR